MPLYTVLAVVNDADVSSCKKYENDPTGAQLTVKLPDADWAGTVMLAGALGVTIWQPFALCVQAL